MRPRVDFAFIPEKMGLNIVSFKDHRYRVRRLNDLLEQTARKSQRIHVIDMNQGHGVLVDELDSSFRQQRLVCCKHNPVQRSTPECLAYPRRILCSIKRSYVD